MAIIVLLIIEDPLCPEKVSHSFFFFFSFLFCLDRLLPYGLAHSLGWPYNNYISQISFKLHFPASVSSVLVSQGCTTSFIFSNFKWHSLICRDNFLCMLLFKCMTYYRLPQSIKNVVIHLCFRHHAWPYKYIQWEIKNIESRLRLLWRCFEFLFFYERK